jgi:hypothetical protein
MKHVICNSCGWVHFEVSVEYVLDWQDAWIDHWLKLNERDRDNYGTKDRPPSYKQEYLCCNRCAGSYTNFRDATAEEVPYGSTIGGIMTREAKF